MAYFQNLAGYNFLLFFAFLNCVTCHLNLNIYNYDKEIVRVLSGAFKE